MNQLINLNNYMLDEKTDFFKHIDNFSKTAKTPSILVFESKLSYLPKVTIAIPTYKRAGLLKEAIDSALNQNDFVEYDVIIVDNNPLREDETEKLLLSYKNPKLSYYKNSENLGMIGNWNRLYLLAKGKWVVMLHDDDLLLPDFLKKTYIYIENDREVGFLHIKHKELSNSELLSPPSYTNQNLSQLHIIDLYRGNILGAPVGLYLKKELVIKIGGFNSDYYPTADYCFYVFFISKYKALLLNEELTIYRILENESMKVETLKGFIKNDYFLSSYLLKKIIPNKSIIKIYQYEKVEKQALGLKKLWNTSLHFSLSELGLDKIPSILSWITYRLINRYLDFIVKKRYFI